MKVHAWPWKSIPMNQYAASEPNPLDKPHGGCYRFKCSNLTIKGPILKICEVSKDGLQFAASVLPLHTFMHYIHTKVNKYLTDRTLPTHAGAFTRTTMALTTTVRSHKPGSSSDATNNYPGANLL